MQESHLTRAFAKHLRINSVLLSFLLRLSISHALGIFFIVTDQNFFL